MSDIGISCQGLSLAQGAFGMENIHFEVKKGYITGLIGRNGSGKTTLIKGISGKLTETNGKVSFGDLIYSKNDAQIRKVLSVMYDTPHFSTKASAKVIAQDIERFEPNFDRDYFEKHMRSFQLDPEKRLNGYSAGMLKKFMLIIALARKPEILILDEPTSGVDPVSRLEMLDLIQEFMEDENHTVLFSTHITSDLDKIADFVALVDDGKMLFVKEKEALKEEYQTHEVLPTIEEIMCHALQTMCPGLKTMCPEPQTMCPESQIDKKGGTHHA